MLVSWTESKHSLICRPPKILANTNLFLNSQPELRAIVQACVNLCFHQTCRLSEEFVRNGHLLTLKFHFELDRFIV